MSFKGGDFWQQKRLEMDVAQLSFMVENMAQKMTVKKSKQPSDIDTEISSHPELEELMTPDHSQHPVSSNVVLEKSEALGEEKSHDMGQKLMKLESIRIRNASSIILTIAKTGAQVALIS